MRKSLFRKTFSSALTVKLRRATPALSPPMYTTPLMDQTNDASHLSSSVHH